MGKDIDRSQHSLLRSDWREYLKQGLGTSESERKLRQRIRDRAVTGLYDIAIINQHARNDDIRQIFERLSADATENTEQSDKVNGSERELTETHFVAAKAMISLAWRGLRECGLDKHEIFDQIVVRAIEDAEADYQDVPHGRVESDISFKTLQAHADVEGMDPVEKWERDLALSSKDIQTLHKRLSEHPDVETTIDKDIGDLINEHLVEDDDGDG